MLQLRNVAIGNQRKNGNKFHLNAGKSNNLLFEASKLVYYGFEDQALVKMLASECAKLLNIPNAQRKGM